MPKVTFSNTGQTVEFAPGKLPYDEHGKPESVLDVAINFGVQIEHACGGSCACTTCHIIVKDGDGNLSPADDDELDRLDMAPGLTLHSRLACQAVVTGDVTVEILLEPQLRERRRRLDESRERPPATVEAPGRGRPLASGRKEPSHHPQPDWWRRALSPLPDQPS